MMAWVCKLHTMDGSMVELSLPVYAFMYMAPCFQGYRVCCEVTCSAVVASDCEHRVLPRLRSTMHSISTSSSGSRYSTIQDQHRLRLTVKCVSNVESV